MAPDATVQVRRIVQLHARADDALASYALLHCVSRRVRCLSMCTRPAHASPPSARPWIARLMSAGRFCASAGAWWLLDKRARRAEDPFDLTSGLSVSRANREVVPLIWFWPPSPTTWCALRKALFRGIRGNHQGASGRTPRSSRGELGFPFQNTEVTSPRSLSPREPRPDPLTTLRSKLYVCKFKGKKCSVCGKRAGGRAEGRQGC